jgi:hypothetical protein
MSYSDFTLQTVVKALQLVLNERTDLFAQIPESTVSDHLAITLKENVPLALAINTEKARSELIIAAILVALRKMLHIPADLVVDQWASVGECSSHHEYLCSAAFEPRLSICMIIK